MRQPGDTNFDWAAVFEMLDGGFAECVDEFADLALTGGYVQTFRLEMHGNNPDWKPLLSKRLYFKSRDKYGRLDLELFTNYKSTTSGLTLDVVLNSTCERSLEPERPDWRGSKM